MKGGAVMRVITGTARSKALLTPEGLDTRPTVARVKEGIFNAIQFDIEGRRVLDLFAGSGQLGIEALSRGAESAVFVDNMKKSLDCISKNLENTGLKSKSEVVNGDFQSFLSRTNKKFDIVFLDPPYYKGLIEKSAEKLFDVTSDYCTLVCESALDDLPPEELFGFHLKKRYRYGKVSVGIYKKSFENKE